MPFIGNVTSIQIHRISSPHFTTVYVKTRSPPLQSSCIQYCINILLPNTIRQIDRWAQDLCLGFLVSSLRSTAERKPSNTAKKHVHPKPISARAAYINSSCQCWPIRLGPWPPIQLLSRKRFYSMALKDALNGTEVTFFSRTPEKSIQMYSTIYYFAMRVLNCNQSISKLLSSPPWRRRLALQICCECRMAHHCLWHWQAGDFWWNHCACHWQGVPVIYVKTLF